MACISTYVFFDIETTGLPYQEHNRTKIIELSFIAVTRDDMRRHKGTMPPICKLTFVLNPHKTIYSAGITGLTNEILKYAPTFKQKINTINYFLEDLVKPVCLVAHNGNIFDYKILLAECADADVNLPGHLLCVDSLPGFRKLLKNKAIIDESIITDDEDEWPDLNITPEEFQEIDTTCEILQKNKQTKNRKKTTEKKPRESFKLTDIYRKLLQREPENAHRAEDDCLMLLKCVAVCQNTEITSKDFLQWIDDNCKLLNEITPLKRK